MTYLIVKTPSGNYVGIPASDGQATPDTPLNLTAVTYGAARIDLSWSAVTGATSYLLERSPAGANTWSTVPSANAITIAAWKDTGLTATTAYDYRVSAVGTGGTPAPSSTATATATAAGTLPTAPIEFNVLPFSASSIKMSWNKQSGSSYFVIQRSTDGANWKPLAVVTDVPYSDTGLPPSTSYFYRVFGGNVGGEIVMFDTGAGSDVAQTTMAVGAPAIPTYHGWPPDRFPPRPSRCVGIRSKRRKVSRLPPTSSSVPQGDQAGRKLPIKLQRCLPIPA